MAHGALPFRAGVAGASRRWLAALFSFHEESTEVMLGGQVVVPGNDRSIALARYGEEGHAVRSTQ